MTKKIIIGNWKMNPATYAEADKLARGVIGSARTAKNVEVVLCPPFVWLDPLSKLLKPKTSHLSPLLGAQDVFWEKKGAFTGEISPAMLENSKVQYVIAGHSERRRWLGETDEMVNKKVVASLSAGLRVILCVGEPREVRRRGLEAAKRFVANQLRHDLRGVSGSRIQVSGLVVAYEPIWAISTSRSKKSHDNSDTPEDALKMIRFMKSWLTIKHYHSPILYGGSVDSRNVNGFLGKNEIDGALVGGASLNAKEFSRIITIASKIHGNR